MIRTAVTRTPQISSTACLTCVLWAADATRNGVVVLLHLGSGLLGPDRRQDDVAGALRGRAHDASSSAPAGSSAARRLGRDGHGLALAEHPVEALERGLGDEQRAGPEQAPRRRSRRPSARRSSAGCGTSRRGVLGVVDDDHERAVLAPLGHQRDRVLGPRRVERAVETPIEPSAACSESAILRAFRYALRFTLTAYERGCGPNTTPPPANCAARVVPWRARPVPFWRNGLARPPATWPRVFVACVPCRRDGLLGPHHLVQRGTCSARGRTRPPGAGLPLPPTLGA